MAYRDFQHFLDELRAKGELRRIGEPVSPYLEVTEIADRVMKTGGPALLFENVVGPAPRIGTPDPMSAVMGRASIHRPSTGAGSKYSMPIAINTLGTRRRMSMALSCGDFEEHAERLRSLIQLPADPPKNLKGALDLAPKLLETLRATRPTTVNSGPCQETVTRGDEVDLTKLPVLTCWPEDGGPYVTLPMVFTHDPRTGKRNVGMYRIQIQGRNQCGMHWQMHKTGARHMEDAAGHPSPSPAASSPKHRMEVAVALGGDPALMFSAISPLPPGIDEMVFAGFLRRDGVRMVKCKTIDTLVPADAEIVLEGWVDPAERRLEGPFGDHTGYYSLAEDFPVFHVECVTQRESPVYPATIVGRPPMEDGWMGKAVERIFMPLIQMTVPEIVDMNLPVEACFHNVAFVSIRKKYPGHAYKVMNAIWGLGGLAFTKFVFVFDEDTNVQDIGEVLFRLGANCDPGRDSLPTKGPVDQLDHSAQQEGFGGKIGFDCTHKWPGENGFNRHYPKLISMAPDVVKKIDDLWPRLGL